MRGIGISGWIALVLLASGCQKPPLEKAGDVPAASQSPAPAREPPDVPAQTAAARPNAAAVSLENTHWKLVQVAGLPPVIAPADRAEAYFILDSAQKQAQGFDGCNRMMGPYESDGQNLKFGALVATQMACDYPGNPEDAFMEALTATARAKVLGNKLELYDTSGALLATLEGRSKP